MIRYCETKSQAEFVNLADMFDGAYGVIIDGNPVESIWLKVDAYQANYLRSLPLHTSQRELERNADYSKFSIRVRPTYDLRQKLLTYGSMLEVLKPESLRAEMREEAKKMYLIYNDDEQ